MIYIISNVIKIRMQTINQCLFFCLLQDLTDPAMVMFEQLEEDQDGVQEEKTFEVTEAIPDVELFGYKTSTRSIEVISGA